MSEQLKTMIAVMGIDIGKNSFHIVGLDDRGAIALRQKRSRSQVEARLANMLAIVFPSFSAPTTLRARCSEMVRF